MKKTKKILAIFLAFILIGVLLFYTNAFVGNPISKFIVTYKSDKYISEKYSDLDLDKEGPTYSFKFGEYYVRLQSKTVKDINFTLSYSPLGKLNNDNYDYNVTQRGNVIWRMDNEYSEKLEEMEEIILKDDFFKDSTSLSINGHLFSFELMGELDTEFLDNDGLKSEDLELDKKYDAGELGKKAGAIYVVFRVDDEKTNIEYGAKMLVHLKELLDKNNIGFYYIDFSQYNSEGNYAYSCSFIKYDEIGSDNLVEIMKSKQQDNNKY